MQKPGVNGGIDLAEVNRIIRTLAMYSSEAAEKAQSAIIQRGQPHERQGLFHPRRMYQ